MLCSWQGFCFSLTSRPLYIQRIVLSFLWSTQYLYTPMNPLSTVSNGPVHKPFRNFIGFAMFPSSSALPALLQIMLSEIYQNCENKLLFLLYPTLPFTDSEIRTHDGKPNFLNPSILIDFPITSGPGRFWIDRSWHCGHLGLCILLETSFAVFQHLLGCLFLQYFFMGVKSYPFEELKW